MTTMVRKQIYIEARQDELLKQWAEESGKSQAEIVRQALDRWLVTQQRRREAEPAWAAERASRAPCTTAHRS